MCYVHNQRYDISCATLYVNPVCINTPLRINELDFTPGVVKVALNSCFQSNVLLLTSNYNNLSVCEP